MASSIAPYRSVADNLRENGYHPMPAMPGKKIPGEITGRGWEPMRQWTQWCDKPAPPFVHDRWSSWDDAGVCIAHGRVIGVDLDTDRQDIGNIAKAILPESPCARRGAKGYMGYYRPGAGMDDFTARVRWHDKDGGVVFEILLHGTQSVLPPTIHPDTGRPYEWISDQGLPDTDIADLPELTADHIAKLSAAFEEIDVKRQAPKRVSFKDYSGAVEGGLDDIEKPWGRSLNDRAQEADALDKWWPALDLPKSRQRGRGAWEAVAFWRPSNSGRALADRNPNLRAVPSGIVDFGENRSYTPLDLVMLARDCTVQAAGEWLTPYVRPENIPHVDATPILATPDTPETSSYEGPLHDWGAIPIFHGARSFTAIKPARRMTEREFQKQFPDDPPPFPIQAPATDIPGGLGVVAAYLDNASATMTEAGGLAVALPLLGALMGRAYETPTGLRSNIYTVALGPSGAGKTSLVKPAKEMLTLCGAPEILGQDRIASGSGLITMLTTTPRRICFLDEFGHMLQQIGSAGSGIHAKQILSEFTALYSAANTLYTGTAYATREPDPIDSPHLCLFGMATPDQFWDAFGSSSLEDGSIARYVVMPIGDTVLKTPSEEGGIQAMDALKGVLAAMSGAVRGNLGIPSLKRVAIEDRAEQARKRLQAAMAASADYADENAVRGGGPIMRRVAENAAKIALVAAVARNPENPVIDPHDFSVGHAIAQWSAQVMVANIRSRIADNQIERDVNDVERFIHEAGERGRRWRDIQARFRRIRTRDLKEITEALERQETVRVEITQKAEGGHPVKTYFRT